MDSDNFADGMGGGWRIFLGGRGGLDGKEMVNLWRGGSDFLEIPIIIFVTTLIWVAVCMQIERCCITCYYSVMILAYFVSLKVSLVVPYFLDSLFKRKRTMVHVFVLCPLLFTSRRGRMWALSTKCKNDDADSIDWMSSLWSNFMEEINPNSESLRANT